MPGTIRVQTSGQSLSVNITRQQTGAAAQVFSDYAMTTAVSLPATISVDTSFYVPSPDTVVISVMYSGAEIASQAGTALTQYLPDGRVCVIAPTIDVIERSTMDKGTYRSGTIIAGTGIDPTGVADSTAAIQSIITNAAVGASLFLPAGVYRLTSPLVFTKSVTLAGAGVTDVWGGRAVAFDYPNTTPYLTGSVFLVTAAATDAIQITGTGAVVNFSDFGIRFADAIRFTNTGHGIVATPAAAYNTYLDHGLTNAHWRNIKVYGHDGNHVAYLLTNPLLCQFDHLRSYGGGVLRLVNNSDTGNYGNSLFNDLYGDVFVGGSAHGIEAISTHGQLNLMQFNRPQIIVESGGLGYGATNATSAQYCFKASGTSMQYYTVVAPDFETTVGSTCDFGTGNYKNIDPNGLYCGVNLLAVNGSFRTPTPTATSGAGAGTSPAAITVVGDEYSGYFTIPIGTSPPAPGQVIQTIIWPRAQQKNGIVLTPRDAFAGALGLYATPVGNGFTVKATATPAASGLYYVHYVAGY